MTLIITSIPAKLNQINISDIGGLMKHLTHVLILGLILALCGTLSAQDKLNIDVKEHTLENGLKFLVVENHDAPVFSAIVRAKVGAVDEIPRQTGISHFLEHMMFKGTEIFGTRNYEVEKGLMAQIDSLAELLHAEWQVINDPLNYPPDSTLYKKYRDEIAQIQEEQKQYVIKDELWETYLKHGGTGLNASTGSDGTQYYVSLPANRLELWFLMESDRHMNTIFREFYSERDVVYEERRLRTDNSPYGKLSEQFHAAAFTASGYGHPVVGWAPDVETWDHDLLKEYYHNYYTPNNMIVAIAGDVDAGHVFELAEKYFSGWQRGPEPPRRRNIEPEQKGERRIDVQYDANPMLMIGYHIPAAGHPDIPALDVLSDILSRGRTARLYKSIVDDQKLSSGVSAYSDFGRYSSLFTFRGGPLKGVTTQQLEDAIYVEIEKIKQQSVTEWELKKVHNQFDASMIKSVNSNMGMCWRLANYEAITGSWEYINKYWQDYKTVTSEDIKRVANKYLVKSNRTVAILDRPEETVEEKTGDATLSGVSY